LITVKHAKNHAGIKGGLKGRLKPYPYITGVSLGIPIQDSLAGGKVLTRHRLHPWGMWCAAIE